MPKKKYYNNVQIRLRMTIDTFKFIENHSIENSCSFNNSLNSLIDELQFHRTNLKSYKLNF